MQDHQAVASRGLRIWAYISRGAFLTGIIWALLAIIHASSERIGAMTQEDLFAFLMIIGAIFYTGRRLLFLPKSRPWITAWACIGFAAMGVLVLGVLAIIGYELLHLRH